MSLAYKFRKAEKTIQRLSAADREIALAICGEIRAAQEALQKASRSLMAQCIQGCEGLCCRNGQFDEIIDFWDLVFILLSCPSERAAIRSCVEKEIPLFTADCVFLAKGTGPCIFSPNTRPEICIVTFCADASAIQKEITRVKCKFIKLGWFIRFRKPIGWLRRLGGRRKKGRYPECLKRSI
jgi:hypothetical protein